MNLPLFLFAEESLSGKWTGDSEKEWRYAHEFGTFTGTGNRVSVASRTVTILLNLNALPILVDIEPETYYLDITARENSVCQSDSPSVLLFLNTHLGENSRQFR